MVDLYLGDCLNVMMQLPPNSVDAIITDPPYGTTACKWDAIIPFGPMWECIARVKKKQSPIVLFCTQPFTSALIMSNPKWFKYCWTWDKKTGKGHLVARIRPLQQSEDIAVFGNGRITYYPQMVEREKPRLSKEYARTTIMGGNQTQGHEHIITQRYPKTILQFPWSPGKTLHPTQKPVPLMEYLIRTYTKPGDTVLDFAMGSGSTGVACLNTDRKFVGIEIDQNSYDIAISRIGG